MILKLAFMVENNETIHNRKVIFFFICLSIVILVFSFDYLRQRLYNPFIVEIPGALQKQLDVEAGDNKQVTIAELKEKDTDQDGLTDYQELYQYQTSIFLEDTDSDGYSDYEEVTQGEQPLCPRGENCNVLSLITPSTKLSEVVGEVVANPDLTILEATLNEFRQFLLANNVSPEDIDSLSDNDLLVILSALNEVGLNDNGDIEELSVEEIRNFLLNQPQANEEEINNLSATELLEIRDKLIQK